jgi:predicted nucleotidyltransferase
MASPLAELLFNEYRRKVLCLLLLHPDNRYHVREIARQTGTVAGTLHKELTRLAEAGLLNKQVSGHQTEYSANKNCLIYEELRSILRKTAGISDVLAEALAPLVEHIQTALVFGSVAKGTETTYSDIDLLVIGDVDFTTLVKTLYPTQEMLGREINPKIYLPQEWANLQNNKDAFMQDITQQPKLHILGQQL